MWNWSSKCNKNSTEINHKTHQQILPLMPSISKQSNCSDTHCLCTQKQPPNNFIIHNFLTANTGCLIVHVQHNFPDSPKRSLNLASTIQPKATCSHTWLLPCPPLLRALTKKSLWSHPHHANSNLPPLGKTKLYLWDPVGSAWTESFECFSEVKVLQKSFQKPLHHSAAIWAYLA